MSSNDRQPEASEPTTPDGGPAAWPPQEAAPPEERPKPAKPDGSAASSATPPETAAPDAAASSSAEPPRAASSAAPDAEPAKPAAASPAAGEGGAALPAEEMPFSNSTLHWLDDADQAQTEDPSHRITVPGYDPTAPVAGRRRAVLVVGGAGALAIIVTCVLYLMAPRRPVVAEPPAAEPARDLTVRAEAALDANKIGEAVDLARLALVADARFADAHFVVGMCDKARNEIPGAREELRRYLELAPLGTHAAAAREALAALPP
jgi:hypothetical protein